MAEQIQELIDKIKSEGIQTAEQKAQTIEKEAEERAKAIIAEAENKAAEIVALGKEEIKRMQESTQKALEQISRDMLLSLRQQIQEALEKIVAADVGKALSVDHLAGVLTDVIQKTAEGNTSVELSPKDLKSLKDGAVAKLQKNIKGGLKFSGSDDISGGFTISYDEGKSSFDFTDESLAKYLTGFLNDQVATILKDSVA